MNAMDSTLNDALEVAEMAWRWNECNASRLEGLAFNVIPKLKLLRLQHAETVAALRAAKVALKEAELLLHKVYVDHRVDLIDDDCGAWINVSNAADRMDEAVDVVEAAISRATGTQA